MLSHACPKWAKKDFNFKSFSRGYRRCRSIQCYMIVKDSSTKRKRMKTHNQQFDNTRLKMCVSFKHYLQNPHIVRWVKNRQKYWRSDFEKALKFPDKGILRKNFSKSRKETSKFSGSKTFARKKKLTYLFS